MAYQQINRDWDDILERFWEGETNEVEEQELKDFFHFGQVPEHLLPYSIYFKSMDASPKTLDQDFDQEMMRRISNQKGGSAKVFNLYRSLAVAAGLTILFAVGSVLIWKPSPAQESLKAICNNDKIVNEAFEQTKQALFMLSNNMEKGESQMLQLTKFDQTHQRINASKK